MSEYFLFTHSDIHSFANTIGMGRTQSSLVASCLGLFLLSVVVFRHEWFYGRDDAIYLFGALVFCGVVCLFAGLFRLITGKWWHGMVAAVALELMLMGAFHLVGKAQPRNLPHRLTGYLTNIYISGFMNCIQYDEEMSQFDPQLQYLLKPESHEFRNLEFRTSVDANTQGIRDSEASLQSPETVFLGDSFTMGWGVSNEESYVSLFKEKTKKKTLNAGVSSFGTAREYLLFKRLPADSCKLLVVQYHDNDLLENYMFFHKGEQLADEQELREGFEKSVRINRLVKHYYPFKHIYWTMRGLDAVRGLERSFQSFQKGLAKKEESKEEGEPFPTDHRPYLVKVLKAIRNNYHGPIVLFHLDKNFSPVLTSQLAQMVDESKDLNVHWLDTQKAGLNARDYFLLDLHLNEAGHRKLADALADFVAKNRLLD